MINKDIDQYYSNKIIQYGCTSKGVDWKDEYGQILRFKQLIKIVDYSKQFSVGDLGCGYGKLLEYMRTQYKDFIYYGFDLSSEMIEQAVNTQVCDTESVFIHIESLNDLINVDYMVASGIFNVKMQYNNKEWLAYISDTLDKMNKNSKSGFAFNLLTKYSDNEYMKDNLYYADPCFMFDYCKRNFSRNISLLHDYNLYEFTILVRKGNVNG